MADEGEFFYRQEVQNALREYDAIMRDMGGCSEGWHGSRRQEQAERLARNKD